MYAAGSQPTRVKCDRVSSGVKCGPGRLRLRHIRFRSKVRWKVREAVMRVVLLGGKTHPGGCSQHSLTNCNQSASSSTSMATKRASASR
jgi:hypothetical protein